MSTNRNVEDLLIAIVSGVESDVKQAAFDIVTTHPAPTCSLTFTPHGVLCLAELLERLLRNEGKSP